MNYRIIYAMLDSELGLLRAMAFQESWEDSTFHQNHLQYYYKIQMKIKEVLKSEVLSETAMPEIQSYLDDLNAYLSEGLD